MKRYLLLAVSLVALTLTTFCQSLPSAIDRIAHQYDLMGGAVVVFCDSGILHSHYFGIADLATHRTVNENTLFRVASISKVITAVAALQLVEQNLVQLDADISDHLGFTVRNPRFPDIPITTRMLLSHTSSLQDSPTYPSFLDATLQEQLTPDLQELLLPNNRFFHHDQFHATQPGSFFQYSNLNYVLIGTLIERITGIRFDHYCQQHIFQPLQIKASFNVQELPNPSNLAVLYRKIDSNWIPQADHYPVITTPTSNLTNYRPGTNAARLGPQGGLRISAIDLSTVFRALLAPSKNHPPLLHPSSTKELLSNQWTYQGANGNTHEGLFLSWGLGVHRITSMPGKDQVLPGSPTMVGHPGEAYGLLSDAYYDPERKIGFIFITNGSGSGYQTSPTSAFYTVEQELFQAIEQFGDTNSCKNNH